MKRIAVLRGGPSSEYDVSLRSGAAVLESLRNLNLPHKDIVITKQGEWLDSGIGRSPEKALEAVDVVFLALHGEYGEDGQVQRVLRRLGLPYTGTDSLGSALAFNKELTKKVLKQYAIKTPKHRRVSQADLFRLQAEVNELYELLGNELFIKPLRGGSSFGTRYVPDISELRTALEEILTSYESVLVEEYIRGREATVGVLHAFRNQDIYVLPAVEIVPPKEALYFSTEAKYSGQTEAVCPGRFTFSEKQQLSDAALAVHTALRLDQYSRADFIVRDGDVYFLEVNTLPGLTKESLFPKAANAVGLQFDDLVNHLIETARV